MSPGDDEYVRNLFSPLWWGLCGAVAAHILMHKEIKRYLSERRSKLK